MSKYSQINWQSYLNIKYTLNDKNKSKSMDVLFMICSYHTSDMALDFAMIHTKIGLYRPVLVSEIPELVCCHASVE